MENVGIIGLGRFGLLLREILAPHFEVKSYDPKIESDKLDEVLQRTSIFIATPIRNFATVIEDIANKIRSDATIIDVCSVKVYPVNIMLAKLPATVDIIASHPMFGPDSFHMKFAKKMMLASIRDQHQRYVFWKNFFTHLGVNVVEMSPDQHDQCAALSQCITHLIGRTLELLPAESTPLDTVGFTQLLDIMQQTCNDSWELFYDLQRYNPYSKATNQKLVSGMQELIKKIDEARDVTL